MRGDTPEHRKDTTTDRQERGDPGPDGARDRGDEAIDEGTGAGEEDRAGPDRPAHGATRRPILRPLGQTHRSPRHPSLPQPVQKVRHRHHAGLSRRTQRQIPAWRNGG